MPCLIFLTAGTMFSQQKEWSLEECIRYAIDNNIQIKQQILQTRYQENTLEQSKLNLLPTLNAQASHNYSFGRALDETSYQFTENEKARSNSFYAGGSFNLFNGLQNLNTIKRNRQNLLVSELDLQSIKDNIALNIALAYLQILLNNELVSAYEPVTTIEAGFSEEKSFTLPVQDAILSGMVRYSSIHPNQSHTENWVQDGDSIYWRLSIRSPGTFRIEMQYGCDDGKTGSSFTLKSGSESLLFDIDTPFNSVILPERDYVKRTESVERTWDWMEIGDMALSGGPNTIILKLVKKNKSEAALIKALRFTKVI